MSVRGFSGAPRNVHLSDVGVAVGATRLAGDRRDRAAANLYDAHGRPAYRLAFALLADEAAAADVVVEAFRGLRRRPRAKRGLPALDAPILLRSVYRAAAVARSGTVGGDRLALIDSLPPEQREALLLSMHGVSCAELAALERTSVLVIAARLEQALRHVRDARGTGPASAVP